MSSNSKKKVAVNGAEETPIEKKKVPLDVDWQELARKKQPELERLRHLRSEE